MRIAVLRGGPSKHYETSLRTGERVLAVLREDERYRPVDIYISKDGEWHVRGKRVEPHQALAHIDLAWNAMHGEFGEDGKLTQLLNALHIPHTGSSTLGLAISLNKDLAKQAYTQHGLQVPKYEVLSEEDANVDALVEVFRTYLHPVVVKTARGKSEVSHKLAHSFDELKEAVADAFRHGERAVIEEFVRGARATCGVIESLRGEKLYSLIPVPNDFRPETHKKIERMAKRAHEALGLRHYSSSKFIVTTQGKVYILETEALPAFDPESEMHHALLGVGLPHKDFVEHVISLAR